ncbi:MAG: hypothetical protein O9267_07225 [Flavobacterium sp.]|uniref:hypothetical protein n=1 Tax=Flavobacterium sp. TaxID=239 RepID=UPI0022BC1F8E|nr:hypothetical protein [Flavobacterium sp.]MCZ8197381.1 hypothetical protein [Flavobacterium sp.]
MKKIKFLIATLIVVFYSCEKDGGDSAIEFQNGATPNITKTAGTDQGINLLALNSGGDLNIGLTVGVGMGDVASMDIIGFYTKGTTKERGVLKTGITSFPSQIVITKADLYNAFTSVNSASDVSLTDKLLITAEITLKNGTVVKIYRDNGDRNFGADISNSAMFKVFQEYIVSCPLNDASLFNGNYTVVDDQWADYAAGDTVPVSYVPSDGTFKFRILNTSNPYLVNTSSYYLVTINPTNNSVSLVSNEPLNYGGGFIVNATGNGTVGSCTGDINLKVSYSGSSQNQTFNLIKQ